MDVMERLATLEAENAAMRKKIELILEHMEFLEDSLDAHIAMQEHVASGLTAIPWGRGA